MLLLSKDEMKKVMGGVAATVQCFMAVNSDNACPPGSQTSWDCQNNSLGMCQDAADELCGSAFYNDCCDDATCKYVE